MIITQKSTVFRTLKKETHAKKLIRQELFFKNKAIEMGTLPLMPPIGM